MKFFASLFLFVSFASQAYVPTVESLYRFGGNPEVTANAAVISFVVRKLDTESPDETLLKEKKSEGYYRLYFTKSTGDALKIAQVHFKDSRFSDAGLDHKIYYPNFTPHTLRPTLDQMEKGLFLSLLHSMIFNNGSQMISYLAGLGVPVKHNNDIINREKVEYLASYKKYLKNISNNRAARKTEINPLKPEDSAARERVDRIMGESMYVDTGHVKLAKEEGKPAWRVSAGAFESIHAYESRAVLRYKYKTDAGEFSVIPRDYWLATGTHLFPKTFEIRNFRGENFEIEIIDYRHFLDKEEDLVKRQKKWDQLLRTGMSTEPRPEFLL